MSNLYKKLVLPSVDKLIKDSELYNIKGYPNSYMVRDVNDILTPYAFEFFRSYGLEPTFTIDLIPRDTIGGAAGDRMIHTDSTIVNGTWRPIVCGINFELLEDSEAEFVWYDMSKFDPICEEKDLDHTEIERKIKLRGITYGPVGEPDGAVVLEKLRYGTTPYLCRTDVPHMVTFNNSAGRRHGLSIRFKEKWTTWEECCKVFEPLMSE